MARWLLILFAMLVQITVTVSPMMLRQCVTADGQFHIELQSQDCHHNCAANGHHDGSASSQSSVIEQHDQAPHRGCCRSCSASESGAADDFDALASSISSRTDCDCVHSLLEVVQISVQRADILSHLAFLAPRDVLVADLVALSQLDDVSLRPVLRVDPDAHLAVMAVVVLRV